jgi:anaerobic ribonucleoside-triphosphate reductase activating protein
MKYHNITHDDMLNGDGIRVVLWVSGCIHNCRGCQNPLTWNPDNGINFDAQARDEIFSALKQKHISGITFSGGDPLHPANRGKVFCLIKDIKQQFPSKTIWIYTGYTWEEIHENKYIPHIIKYADVLVDGRFKEELADVNYPWAGSTNQRVIDIQESIKKGTVILHEHH